MNNLGDESVTLVERDYSEGNLTHFEETLPEQLEAKGVTNEEFLFTMREINTIFLEAETLGMTTFLEGCVGCLTFFSIFLCYQNKYSRQMKILERFLNAQNEDVYRPKGLQWINPLTNGLLHIEIIDLD